MKELKQYIDRVLGNNIRCLLPSYWWKRLFGLVIDEVDGKASKESVATLEKKIENFKGGGVQAITIYPLDRSTKQNYHRQVYDTLVELDAKEEDFIVYAEVGIGGIFPATMIVANSLSDTLHYVFDFRGWEQTENHGYTKTEKEHYTVALFADGTMQLDTTQDYVIDHVISETSTNAVQNKAVAEALGGYVLFPLMNAKEFITSYYNDEKPRARGLVYAVSSDIGDNISEVISLKYGNKQYAIYFVANGSVWR